MSVESLRFTTNLVLLDLH